MGADRARQRTELEMLDGTEVFSVDNGAGAKPVAGEGMWLGAAAGSAAEAGGHPAPRLLLRAWRMRTSVGGVGVRGLDWRHGNIWRG